MVLHRSHRREELAFAFLDESRPKTKRPNSGSLSRTLHRIKRRMHTSVGHTGGGRGQSSQSGICSTGSKRASPASVTTCWPERLTGPKTLLLPFSRCTTKTSPSLLARFGVLRWLQSTRTKPRSRSTHSRPTCGPHPHPSLPSGLSRASSPLDSESSATSVTGSPQGCPAQSRHWLGSQGPGACLCLTGRPTLGAPGTSG